MEFDYFKTAKGTKFFTKNTKLYELVRCFPKGCFWHGPVLLRKLLISVYFVHSLRTLRLMVFILPVICPERGNRQSLTIEQIWQIFQ